MRAKLNREKHNDKRILDKNIISSEINYKEADLSLNKDKKENIIINSRKKKNGIYENDIYLFHEGKNYRSYNFLGAHLKTEKKIKGVKFTTWAPNAKSVTVVGDFCNWDIKEENKLQKVTDEGLWTVFIPHMEEGMIYKLAIERKDGQVVLKSDPYGVASEIRPNTASKIYKPKYRWGDKKWRDNLKNFNPLKSPINVYEVHLGSWKKKDDGSFYSYKELAELLPNYVYEMGYTHVEILPIMEHPLDASWGYQITGFYCPTSRYGKGEDFKFLIDSFHKQGIGVILDWVPGHFCKDIHGLYKFDGNHGYEYEDYLKAENEGWGTANFDLGRNEVRSFLISNALYWFREFHIDGLRVDAVANMLYLDFCKESGKWAVNEHGGNENIQAIEFLKLLNDAVFCEYPNALMIAEESSTWPNVTKKTKDGGLGFNFKWNMGWMNDMLKYIEVDPIFRKEIHNSVTFSMMYHYSENYILSISHDEVVHGKKSLLNKNWGDYWNKFAGLRNFIAYMMGHPGKKTIFMGAELGEFIEWRENEELEWSLIEKYPMHKSTQQFFKDINTLYKNNNSLWKYDYEHRGFQWIDADNSEKSIFIFMRKGEKEEDTLIFISNFTPVVYYDFKVGVPYLSEYEEVLNTDSEAYGGSGQIVSEVLTSKKEPYNNQNYSINVKVPPMATLILKTINIKKEYKVKDLLDESVKK